MGRFFCCTISLASSRSLRDVQLIWRAVIGFNWKWRNTSPLYVFLAVSWSVRFVGKGKSICMKFAQPSMFLHGRRRKKLLSKFRTKGSVNTSIMRADFTQQSSPRSSHGPLRIFAKLSYSRKYRIDLFSHTTPIANLFVGCMALGYVSAQTIWNAKPAVVAIF